MSQNIIVIGGGNHHNALGVIRSLGERGYGIELITIGNLKKNYIASSKYVVFHRALLYIDELTPYLISREVHSTNKEVIISCSDQVTEHLSLCQNTLNVRYCLPGIQEEGKIIEVMDKMVMMSQARRCGIFSPMTWKLPDDIDEVRFPCIIKSRISSHGTKNDIVIFKSKEELRECPFLSYKCFAQYYVSKKEEIQFIGCSLNSGEDVVIPGMTRVLRSQPNTNTGFLEYGPIAPFYNEIVEKAKLMIRSLQYSGLFSFEVLRGEDDNLYFLEINFRNDGNSWCVTKAGVNLPVIWVKSCLGEEWRDEISNPQHIRMMPEFQDFKLVLQGKLRFSKWLKDWRDTNYFMEYDKNDIRPFYQFIFDKISL